MVRKDHGCIGFAFVVGKNPKTPNLSPMADNTLTRGRIGGLRSPVYMYALFKGALDNLNIIPQYRPKKRTKEKENEILLLFKVWV